ncbi:MAG: hypothetical protein NW206_01055 [Hyphomonadaceae bacterium]|nr:hypothetical protein [Hyphomonadaceae bacterium]
MSAAQQIRPKLAFYDVLDKPGGASVDDALARADRALEQHRGLALAEMSRLIRALELGAQSRRDQDAANVFQQSLDVLNLAGLYHPSICRVANSLCDLAERMKAAGRWDWPSVGVHVSSMRLLTDRADNSDPAVASVLRGLAEVVARFPEPGASPARQA